MMRLSIALGLAVYVALASGEVSTFEAVTCSQRCPDDDSDGRCAPDCTDCVCCTHLRTFAVAQDAKPPASPQQPRFPELRPVEPQSPEPGDILHVPKTLPA